MRPRVLPAALMATMVAAGCAAGSPTSPSPVEILPQTYRLGCGTWSPATPPVTRTLVDVYVKGSGEQATETDLAVLRQQGGDIIHQFAAARMVRVAIDIARLLPLHVPWAPDRDFVLFASTVTDPVTFKVVMIVRLDHPVTDGDLAAAVALGGTIRHVYTAALTGYSLEIDDSMVPRLRALPGVVGASLSTWGCIA